MQNRLSRLKIILYILLALLFIPSSSFSEKGALIVHFIDSGYGDAVLLEAPDNTFILIDAGTKERAKGLKKYLDDLGVKEIKAFILTHPHVNHFGGMPEILQNYTIDKFYMNGDSMNAEEGYKELLEVAEKKGLHGFVLRRSDRVKTGSRDLSIKVLHPESVFGAANNNSIALYIIFKNTSILLTSDIQQEEENALIKLFPETRSSNVVQVPHHGGNVTDEFAEFFKGKIFVISTGKNKYNKPLKKDLDKLKGTVLRTDVLGNIVIHSDGESVKVLSE